MKRVGVLASFVFGFAGLFLPGTASAQQYYGQNGQQPYVNGYGYGYDSRGRYGVFGNDWREARREREWREREERHEREWRRHEWREHERWERNGWRDRSEWR
jgi:hypothetical protein